jgi:hypothetical protein
LPGKQVWLNNRFLHRNPHGWPLQLDAVHPAEIVLRMKDGQKFMERVRDFSLIAHMFFDFHIVSISYPLLHILAPVLYFSNCPLLDQTEAISTQSTFCTSSLPLHSASESTTLNHLRWDRATSTMPLLANTVGRREG